MKTNPEHPNYGDDLSRQCMWCGMYEEGWLEGLCPCGHQHEEGE